MIDLVMGLLCCDVGGALDWLNLEYPDIPLADAEARRRWTPGRVGVGGVGIDAVAQSGLLGQLAKPAALILSTLCGLTDPDAGELEISYAGLMRRSGIKNRARMSDGLKLLRRLDLLSWGRGKSPGGWRTPSTYTLRVDAMSCRLAVEKLSMSAVHGSPVGTVKTARSSDGGTAGSTRGKPASDVFAKEKKRSRLRRKGDSRPEPPPAGKDGDDAVEKATPPAPRRRRRRVRHPGFSAGRL